MRLLWVNPVGTDRDDEPMAEALKAAGRPGLTGTVISFAPGSVPAHLEYDAFEAMAIPQVVRTALHFGRAGYDAMIIGCFYDTALEAAREVSGPMLVTGPCISALEIAGALSARFSVLSPTAKAAGHSRRRIRGYGAEGRLASIRPLGILTDQLLTDHATTEARILEEATRAVQDDGAEAILMGCTLEYQAAMKIGDRLGVPMIDAVRAPLIQAEGLAHASRAFGWTPGRIGGSVAPSGPEIEAASLSPPDIGNRVEF
ncbi:aspartate/glutamate racemase family protein [Marinibacterium sp. SX1]|uniref:aspartate/glutamate racemase family protein n=1 Tax=Marinibacterium sp. SX1 TaxID=3388424 RepID=UPI003D17170D